MFSIKLKPNSTCSSFAINNYQSTKSDTWKKRKEKINEIFN